MRSDKCGAFVCFETCLLWIKWLYTTQRITALNIKKDVVHTHPIGCGLDEGRLAHSSKGEGTPRTFLLLYWTLRLQIWSQFKYLHNSLISCQVEKPRSKYTLPIFPFTKPATKYKSPGQGVRKYASYLQSNQGTAIYLHVHYCVSEWVHLVFGAPSLTFFFSVWTFQWKLSDRLTWTWVSVNTSSLLIWVA